MTTWNLTRIIFRGSRRARRIVFVCSKGYDFKRIDILNPQVAVLRTTGRSDRIEVPGSAAGELGDQEFTNQKSSLPAARKNSKSRWNGNKRVRREAIGQEIPERTHHRTGAGRRHDGFGGRGEHANKVQRGVRGSQTRGGSRNRQNITQRRRIQSDVWDTPGVEAAAVAAERRRTFVSAPAPLIPDDASASNLPHGGRSSYRNRPFGRHLRSTRSRSPGKPDNGHGAFVRGSQSSRHARRTGNRHGGRQGSRRRTRNFEEVPSFQKRPGLSAQQEHWRCAMAEYRVEERKNRRRRTSQPLTSPTSADFAPNIYDDAPSARALQSSLHSHTRQLKTQGMHADMTKDSIRADTAHAIWFGGDDVDDGSEEPHLYEGEHERFLLAREMTPQGGWHDSMEPVSSSSEVDAGMAAWWETLEAAHAHLNPDVDALSEVFQATDASEATSSHVDADLWPSKALVRIPPDPFMISVDDKALKPPYGIELSASHASAPDTNAVAETEFFDSTCPKLSYTNQIKFTAWSLADIEVRWEPLWQGYEPPAVPRMKTHPDAYSQSKQGLKALLHDTEHKLANLGH